MYPEIWINMLPVVSTDFCDTLYRRRSYVQKSQAWNYALLFYTLLTAIKSIKDI